MPRETTARFVRIRIRDPKDFTPRTFRTVRLGSHRVVLGHLKGERHRTARGRLVLHVQAILHPRAEMAGGCLGCARASMAHR